MCSQVVNMRINQDSLHVTEEEFEELQKLFNMFDRDRDGILKLKELKLVLRCLGMENSQEQV